MRFHISRALTWKPSRVAAMREFDEPFVITGEQLGDEKALVKAAEQRGLTVTSGGRFYHLQGGNDKGQSMEMIISWYEQYHGKVSSIALGDSPNDFSMLGTCRLSCAGSITTGVSQCLRRSSPV